MVIAFIKSTRSPECQLITVGFHCLHCYEPVASLSVTVSWLAGDVGPGPVGTPALCKGQK